MDIRRKILGSILLSLMLAVSLSIASGNARAAAKPAEINVIGGGEGRIGNPGYFEATYAGKNIKVIYASQSNRANSPKHPVKVYLGDKKIADWGGYLQRRGNHKLPIQGREVTVMGRWKDQRTFEAEKIYLPADTKKMGEK